MLNKKQKMSKLGCYIFIIFMLECWLLDGVTYKSTDLNDCDYPLRASDCLKATNIDTCATLLDCERSAAYFVFDATSWCECRGYVNGGCRDRARGGSDEGHVYEITSFGKCNPTKTWLFSTYLGPIDWGVFWIGQAFGLFITGLACYYFVYKRERRKKFKFLHENGNITNASLLTGFVTWITGILIYVYTYYVY